MNVLEIMIFFEILKILIVLHEKLMQIKNILLKQLIEN